MGIDELVYLKEHLELSLKTVLESSVMDKGQLVITAKHDDVRDVIKFLNEDPSCDFKMLIDITALDYPEKEKRFCVVYNMLSLRFNHRIRVKVWLDGQKPVVDTLTDLFESAGWYEREVFDMFGVVFDGNEDMRRILTDYEFDGHPLRKDFPLTGYNEVRYDEKLGRVVYEPLELVQDYRAFDFESENFAQGMANVQLPGDEKAVKPAFSGKEVEE